jgi:hypothetical protein
VVDEPVEETVEILLTVLATMEWAVLVGMEEHLDEGKCFEISLSLCLFTCFPTLIWVFASLLLVTEHWLLVMDDGMLREERAVDEEEERFVGLGAINRDDLCRVTAGTLGFLAL